MRFRGSKKSTKRFRLSLGLLVASLAACVTGIGLLAAYNHSNRYIADDGALVEPFYLLGLGAFAMIGGLIFAAAAAVVAGVALIKRYRR